MPKFEYITLRNGKKRRLNPFKADVIRREVEPIIKHSPDKGYRLLEDLLSGNIEVRQSKKDIPIKAEVYLGDILVNGERTEVILQAGKILRNIDVVTINYGSYKKDVINYDGNFVDIVNSSERYNGERGIFIPANERLQKSREAITDLAGKIKDFQFNPEYFKRLGASFKNAAPYAGPALGLAVLFLLNSACKPEEIQKVKIQAKVDAVETDNTSQGVLGAQIIFGYNGQNVYATSGQLVDIAEVNKGTTAYVKITVQDGNHKERWIKSEPMTGTHTYTINIKSLNNFDWDGFVNTLAPNNYLTRLKPPADGILNVYFNADASGTGVRLPSTWITEAKRVFDEIKARSNGEITEIKYHENSDKKKTDMPGQGEVFVYHDSQDSGVSNTTFENADGSIYGIKLYFNSSISLGFYQIDNETLDGVLAHGEQNFLGQHWDYVNLAFKRPTGNNSNEYRIYPSLEEQKRTDSYSGAANFLGQFVITTLENRGPTGFMGPSNLTRDARFNPANSEDRNEMKSKRLEERIKK